MIKNILKGMVIGLANIIPGVSGGTMAVSMGIYDKLIHCITHLFKEFKKSVLFLLPIFIGAGLALVALPFVIEKMFASFPLQTNFLFIGLIIGGLPAIWGKVKGNRIGAGHIIVFLAFFAIVAGMAALGETEGNSVALDTGFLSMVKLFFVGIIAAATMVIPGVSGSMMLLLMGYYHPILEVITTFIRSLIVFDIHGITRGLTLLVPAGIGVVLGIFGIAKLVEIVFEKYPLYAYSAIIGLIIASPVAILLTAAMPALSVVNVLTSVVTLAVGTVIAMKLGE